MSRALVLLCCCVTLALTLGASKQAMRTHHLGHFKSYTDKLNLGLRELRNRGGAFKDLAKLGVDTLLARLDEVPEDLRTVIRNNGGGYVNHDLFFKTMAPPSPNNTDGSAPAPREPAPDSKIGLAIVRDFGSFSAFKSRFTELANGVFGSGWVFLYVDGSPAALAAGTGQLAMRATANQDNPNILDQNTHHFSILCVDVWEHAYYLVSKETQTQGRGFLNKRADWLDSWWNIVGWKAVETSYASYLTFTEIMRETAENRKSKAAAAAATPAAAATADDAAPAATNKEEL